MSFNVPAGARERAAERRVQALELRKQGLQYSVIGDRLGVDGATAWKDVRRSLGALAKQETENAGALRQLELERLDLAVSAIASEVAKGSLPAIDRWIRLSESRRRLLGLDAAPDMPGASVTTYALQIVQAQPPAHSTPDIPLAPSVMVEGEAGDTEPLQLTADLPSAERGQS